MCVYCNIGDWAFRNPPYPWVPNPWPNTVPYPIPWKDSDSSDPYVNPQIVPKIKNKDWDLEKLKEYLEILKQVKELEDQIGCPCEPNKADYIQMFKDRIAELEKKKTKKKKK